LDCPKSGFALRSFVFRSAYRKARIVQLPEAATSVGLIFRQGVIECCDMINSGITNLGVTSYRNSNRPFGITDQDRQRHVYILGQTGMGKSTLLLNMLVQDIRRGLGVALIDPHGDLADKLLDHVPRHRIVDVIYVNPADVEYPVGLNLLDTSGETKPHLVASHLIDIFKKIWADSWGPRLEYLLRNAVLALLECGGNTLLGIPRLLIDPEFRALVLSRVHDPVVRTFWQVEYELYPRVFRTETISPIQNKVGQFLAIPMMRNILGQTRNKLDFRAIMDSQKILIVNLGKGKLGEDNARLLGSLIVTKLFLSALSRVDLPEGERRPFSVYIDEFQTFAADSFAHTLSEMRKFGLQLIISHQYLSQLPIQLKSAVFGNVGTLIAFKVGAEDAEYPEKEYFPVFRGPDLSSLPAFENYTKLSINGRTSEPFSARTLPEPAIRDSHQDAIIQLSRMRYGKEKQTVEQGIASWMAYPILGLAETGKKY
jgi:hypothetical protein